MASLQTPGDVVSNSFHDVKSLNQVVGIWHLKLRSSSDTITVPGLQSTSAVASLTSGISVSAAALSSGSNALTITGGSLGTKAVIVTLHRVGAINDLSIDESP